MLSNHPAARGEVQNQPHDRADRGSQAEALTAAPCKAKCDHRDAKLR